MPTPANDPLKATQRDPVSAGRKAKSVTPDDVNDLSDVTSSMIVTIGTGGTGIAVIFADQGDQEAVTIPLGVGSYKLDMQVRRVMSSNTVLGTGGGVVALWG